MDSLTVPELRRLARGRARTRHFEAVRMQWWVSLLRTLLPHVAAEGYLMAKAAMSPGDSRRLQVLKLDKWLDNVPGFDKKLAAKRGKRRR